MAMVFDLIPYVFPDCFNVRPRHTEGSISVLPGESPRSDILVHPSRGRRFDTLQYVRDSVRRSQTDQYVNVVLGASDLKGHTSHASNDTAHVCVEAIPPRIEDGSGPIPGAEDELKKQAHVSRGQGNLRRPCRGAMHFMTPIPGFAVLTPGYFPRPLRGT